MKTRLTQQEKDRKYRQHIALRAIWRAENNLSKLPAADQVDELQIIAEEAEIFGGLSDELEQTQAWPVWAI